MLARLGALIGAFLLALPAAAQAAPVAPAPAVKWITEASATLDHWYDPANGQYRTTNWWNSANALRAQLVASALLGNNLGPEHAANTYNQNIGTWFRNDYYDDEGWWGLTWVQPTTRPASRSTWCWPNPCSPTWPTAGTALRRRHLVVQGP